MRFFATLFLAATVAAGPLSSIIPRSVLETRASAQQSILAAHNSARSSCGGAQPLTWDNGIAGWAQNYANQRCSALPRLIHSGRGGYGENLAANSNGDLYNMVWKQWIGELKSYPWGNPGFYESTGHFTQAVWKATKRVGCGWSRCNGMTLLVCQYWPQGNVMLRGNPGKYFRDNVKPPRSALKGLNAVGNSVSQEVTDEYQTQETQDTQENTTQENTTQDTQETTENYPQGEASPDAQQETPSESAKFRRHEHHKRIITPMR